jgi:hypothetical protein
LLRHALFLLLAALVLLALSAGRGFAQDRGAIVAPDAPRDERAHKFFEAGRGAYDVGSYREALNYFQQSFELSGRPVLLYNIGQCADHLRMDEVALDAFQRYATAFPDADNHLQVVERIRVLEGVVKEKKATAEREAAQAAAITPENVAAAAPAKPESSAATAAAPAETPSPWYARWYTWAGIGGAVAAAVVVGIVASGSSAGAPTHHTPNSGVHVDALRAAQ